MAVQLRLPDVRWLDLSPDSARQLFVEQPGGFPEALTVAQAYGLMDPLQWGHAIWNQVSGRTTGGNGWPAFVGPNLVVGERGGLSRLEGASWGPQRPSLRKVNLWRGSPAADNALSRVQAVEGIEKICQNPWKESGDYSL